MKKIISLMLVLVMVVFAFVSCGKCECVDEDKDGKCDKCGEAVEPDDPDTPDTPADPVDPEEAWKAAFDFSNVKVDYRMAMTASYQGQTMTNEMVAEFNFMQGTMFVITEEDGETYTFVSNDADFISALDFSEYYSSFTFADGKYTAATLQIVDGDDVVDATNVEVTIVDGKVASVAFDAVMEQGGIPVDMELDATFRDYGEVTIPADVAMDYYDYEGADIGDLVVVEAYVQATQSWWNNKITVYLADRDGAYFAYEMACTEEDAAKLTPGTKIRIIGTKGEWAGEVEIMDCTFTFVEGADTYVAEAKDLTGMLGSKDLIDFQNQLAKFTDMTVKAIEYKNGTPGDDIYVTLTKNGVDYSFCVEYYLNGSDADFYNQFATLKAGDVIDVEGFVYWYNGINTHITKITK